MKLTVKCSVGGDPDCTKELMIHNPAATLSNLRAAIAINFRLPVYGFRMSHSSVDLSSEKLLLRDSGVKDGDIITVVAKRLRGEGDEGEQQKNETPTNQGVVASVASRIDDGFICTAGEGVMVNDELRQPNDDNKDHMDNDSDDETEEGDDEEEEDALDAENEEEDGPTELLGHLLETVPNLAEMRREFLANPSGMMQEIRQRDPRLFELITANHQAFIDLVNNEDLVEALQQEQEEAHASFFDEEGELDEETEDAINSFLAQYIAGGLQNDGGDEVEEEEAGNGGRAEMQNYLERVPTEEEEAKIEQLVQLGFTRDQCKVAFFKSKRSLERAANLLFEDPPQL